MLLWKINNLYLAKTIKYYMDSLTFSYFSMLVEQGKGLLSIGSCPSFW